MIIIVCLNLKKKNRLFGILIQYTLKMKNNILNIRIFGTLDRDEASYGNSATNRQVSVHNERFSELGKK